ncbi:MAG TPA: thrombospondin type 3 repeat-containing protein [Candidatus Hydrogenedentes bacterium]|nr:thrombospondin type 3 repeat-containing protein [Candidatus Hydrogenedentota bacterium]HRT21097.1 thrombospondin type 3 repeat-containing protein [Candidatus Hydrogenedentota bacterium]HRT66030.1 thrombospondin type 3 repeat-containing protein [Candidatus Hydrogenedentota bacterium]
MKRWSIMVLLIAAPMAFANPWASRVVAYQAGSGALFTDPSKALGPPSGGGPSTPNNDSLVSLGGPGGYLVLEFDSPVEDDPDNPMGLDCTVFTNAFWTGGNPQVRWQEPAIIEIAENAAGPWYLIPGSRGFSPSPMPSISEPSGTTNDAAHPYYLAGSIRNPNLFDADTSNDQFEYNWGYAKLNPTAEPYLDNYLRPDDPMTVGLTARSGGGDPFDIAWAVDAAGQPANLQRFRFIRLSSFIARNMGPLGICSPDIDAVADIAPDADTDGDGLLDEYETLLAGSDPNRPESTVLPLEIPALEGGSPTGTLLGTAQDAEGNVMRLYAAEQRTAEGRALSARVDILTVADPGPALPSMSHIKSACVREFRSDITDFLGAGIQSAEFVMHYTASEIIGLAEDGLQPYRYENGGYTTADIAGVTVNAAANRVTFRSRRPGIFILASVPGPGDAESQTGPQGPIVLHGDPPGGIPVGPSNTALFTSDTIRDEQANPVADGVRFTVAVTAGKILGDDADAVTPGIQTLSSDGRIQFAVEAPTASQSALVSATSVEGAAYGELAYSFFAGPPVAPMTWTVGKPEPGTPVRVTLTSGVVRDAYGNPVRDGTLLTIVCMDAAILSGDASSTLPGDQIVTVGGRTFLEIESPDMASLFRIVVYADPAIETPIGDGIYSAADYIPMPLSPWALLIVMVSMAVTGYHAKVKGGGTHGLRDFPARGRTGGVSR